ncbi:MAG: response regulator [Rhodospirillales bacterium]|nr:response regulator [Rhodospirillales bacterium]
MLKYVLIVDDDPTMQLILQGMVEKAGYKAVIAESGEKALQFLEVGQGNISVILLDYNMPDMDGMEVVQAVRERKQLADVPIIMQSGSTDLKQIREVIEGGVYHYLSKPFPIEALQVVLSSALEESKIIDVLHDRVMQGYAPANLIRSAAFVMRTRANARSLSILLATLFPNPARVFPGLLAVMMNAIEHGTLEMDYEKKAALIKAGTLELELERLEGLKKNKTKEVAVQFIHKDKRLSVRITDPGRGFDWKSYVAFSIERERFVNGYGLLKARQSFDEVKYNTAGNQVTVSVFE